MLDGIRILDNHAHIFPRLGGAAGYPSPEEHLAVLQRAFAFSGHPARRAPDGPEVRTDGLWEPTQPGPEGRRRANFRVDRFGRVAWELDGVTYHRQFMPPMLADMSAPPELLLAMMDDAGVDAAVLLNDRNYGQLNREIADAVRRYPGRFIGLALLDEGRAWEEDQLAELRRAAGEGLRGLYFKLQGLGSTGFRENPFGDRYEVLWQEVGRLRWPVYWDLTPLLAPTAEDYLRQLRQWAGWLERHPDLPAVMPNGLLARFLMADGRFRIPDWLGRALVQSNVLVELSLPIQWGGRYDYPYSETLPILEEHYRLLGPSRLVWGSDVPNVERFCKYRQAITHLARSWPGVPPADLALILGGNLSRLFATSPAAGGT